MNGVVSCGCDDPVGSGKIIGQIVDPAEFAQVAELGFVALAVHRPSHQPERLGFGARGHGQRGVRCARPATASDHKRYRPFLVQAEPLARH